MNQKIKLWLVAFIITLSLNISYSQNPFYQQGMSFKALFMDYQSQNGGNISEFKAYHHGLEIGYHHNLQSNINLVVPVKIGVVSSDNIEIREYYESMNISYHDSFSDSYFQYLANYIFGGNYKNEKISMTSPVTMRQYGDQEMIFRLPKKFLKEKAPQPQNNKIKIFKIDPKIKAAIKYSGYTNSNIERKKTEEKIKLFNENEQKQEEKYSQLIKR